MTNVHIEIEQELAFHLSLHKDLFLFDCHFHVVSSQSLP